MSANNANDHHRYSTQLCPFDDGKMNALIDCVRDNSSQIESLSQDVKTLSAYHQNIIKWLLMAIIFIALGSKGMEMLQSLWGHKVRVEAQQ